MSVQIVEHSSLYTPKSFRKLWIWSTLYINFEESIDKLTVSTYAVTFKNPNYRTDKFKICSEILG